MTWEEKKNMILDLLKGKNMGQWTQEPDIEEAVKESINHVEVREILPEMASAKHVEFSRNVNSYKITPEGRRLSINGGYKQ